MADDDGATIVLFSGELDRALAALNIANASGAMGIRTTIFFTFWGLNAVRRPKPRSKTTGLLRRLMRWWNKGGTRRLKLSRFHMRGLGTWMMKKLMRAHNTPMIEDMIAMAHKLGVKMVACSTSMTLMGLSKEDLVDEVDEVAGAAAYVGESMKSKLDLFI